MENTTIDAWPDPFHVDTYDKYRPNLLADDDEVEKWLHKHKKLYIRTVTWNVGAKTPPATESLNLALLPRNKYHLYVIGTEECERSIAKSALNTSKKNWEAAVAEALGPVYVPIRSHTLQATHIIAFIHKAIQHLCAGVTSAAVATGAGNTLGNKGAVAVYFKIGYTSILVVNAHLAAHQDGELQRNADYDKINKMLPVLIQKRNSSSDVEGIVPSESSKVQKLPPIISKSNVQSNIVGIGMETKPLQDKSFSGLSHESQHSRDSSTVEDFTPQQDDILQQKASTPNAFVEMSVQTVPEDEDRLSTRKRTSIKFSSEIRIVDVTDEKIPGTNPDEDDSDETDIGSVNISPPSPDSRVDFEGITTSKNGSRHIVSEENRIDVTMKLHESAASSSHGMLDHHDQSNGSKSNPIKINQFMELQPPQVSPRAVIQSNSNKPESVTSSSSSSSSNPKRLSFNENSGSPKAHSTHLSSVSTAEKLLRERRLSKHEIVGINPILDSGVVMSDDDPYLSNSNHHSDDIVVIQDRLNSHASEFSETKQLAVPSVGSIPVTAKYSGIDSSGKGKDMEDPHHSKFDLDKMVSGEFPDPVNRLIIKDLMNNPTINKNKLPPLSQGTYNGMTGPRSLSSKNGQSSKLSPGFFKNYSGMSGYYNLTVSGNNISSPRLNRTMDQCAQIVIFMGDLNYRIKGNRRIIDKLIQSNMYEVLLQNDQLRINKEKSLVLQEFTEPPLRFRPTYKLDIGMNNYDSGPKNRMPAWTDRILYIDSGSLICFEYNSDPSIMTSDHRPVYASFVADIQLPPYEVFNEEEVEQSERSSQRQSTPMKNEISPRPLSTKVPVKFTSESQVCVIS